MYLTKLLMKDFGKFHNKEVNLKPGINIICGGADSGKSTQGFPYSHDLLRGP